MSQQKPGAARITAAVVAVAAMLPYLTLKILWMTGSSLGINDPDLMNDPTMAGLNAMTFGMDVVGLLLALAFTVRQGMRLPAWLVLLPLWVGTGLLTIVVVMVPLGVLLEGTGIFSTGGPIEPWVYMMVYGGFVAQGVGLTVAFALYSRDRWPTAFRTPIGHGPTSVTMPLQRVVARGALLMTVLLGGIRLYWALGGRAGLPEEMAGLYPATAALQDGLKGLLAIGAGLGLVILVNGRGGRPVWQPLSVAWLGTGTMFGWGLYTVIIGLSGGPLSEGSAGGVLAFVNLFEMLTGLVMGMCGAFLLAERSGVGHVQAAQQPLEGEDRERDGQPADHGHR
ncbi:hypothetical protein [Nonomuraea sp. NPDC048916]|uniref:hypothetical protein n=1 Tax=Nonomuraea sp. NPDC048916 TaxID=3154232 RepID=UPI0033D4E33D